MAQASAIARIWAALVRSDTSERRFGGAPKGRLLYNRRRTLHGMRVSPCDNVSCTRNTRVREKRAGGATATGPGRGASGLATFPGIPYFLV